MTSDPSGRITSASFTEAVTFSNLISLYIKSELYPRIIPAIIAAAILVLAMAIQEHSRHSVGAGLMEIATEINSMGDTLWEINQKENPKSKKKGG